MAIISLGTFIEMIFSFIEEGGGHFLAPTRQHANRKMQISDNE